MPDTENTPYDALYSTVLSRRDTVRSANNYQTCGVLGACSVCSTSSSNDGSQATHARDQAWATAEIGASSVRTSGPTAANREVAV